jgi:PAS domain S-box-containing protein
MPPTSTEISLSTLPLAAVLLDPAGRVEAANPPFLDLFAWETGEAPEATVGTLFPAEERALERLAASGRDAEPIRLQSRRRTGVPFTADAEVSALPEGRLLCLLREVRDGRLIEASREYLDLAFERAPIGMALFNTDGEYVRVNAELCRMLGRAQGGLLGRRDQELTHPDDRQADVDAAWRILNGEIDVWRTEKRFLADDGSVVWAIANLSFMRDAAGRPLCWLGQFQDITPRKRQEDQLRRERDFSASLVACLQDGVEVLSPEGEILDVNERLCELTGCARDELIGMRPPFPFWAPEEASRQEAALRAALSAEGGVERDLVMRRRDGREVPVIATIAPLRDGDGAILAYVGTVKDVSERHRVERMRQEFLALASHELRTPLTSVVGYLETVTDGDAGPLSAEQARLLAVAERNAKHLARLVEDVVEVARVDAGRLQLELAPVCLAALASECADTARPSAQAAELELLVEGSPTPSLVGDRRRLRQVVDNLLANAIKFTPPGGRVEVRTGRRDGEAVLDVRDTGIGMSPAEQERLFERFYRAEGALRREIRGTGLGLAIAREIVQAHGGRIECRSAEGIGSTFRVALPAGGEEPSPAPGSPAA